MPMRPLRQRRSQRDLRRRSTLDPAGLFAPPLPAISPDAVRLAVSEDGPRPAAADVGRKSTSGSGHGDAARSSSPPVQEATPATRRFSLMRFRHASDSQLSAKAKHHAQAPPVPPVPPVPAMPAAQPPAIITTAPTLVDTEMDAERTVSPPPTPKRSRLQQLGLRRRSFDPSTASAILTAADRPSTLRKSMDRKRRPTHKKDPSLAESDAPADPQPLGDSTASLHLPATVAPPLHRASESSRSEDSSGGPLTWEHTSRPTNLPRHGSTRFGFGRRKQRASLFPLPMKIEPSPSLPEITPGTPYTSTSGANSTSPLRSPAASPPPTARRLPRGDAASQGPRTAANTPNLASSGSLFRNDSTKSLRSVRSQTNTSSTTNANGPLRMGLRGRSSTMGSMSGRSDGAASPTPPGGPSGRNSTSTVGRSSFSNLFGLGSRFRNGPEPHSPRHASPAHGFLGNSGLTSHHTSLNISRETLVLPEREEGETPGHYLARIEEDGPDKSIIASALSKTENPFLLSVLRSYMRRFAFFGDPIDMAIRKLLMQVELPKETQQIDRVLQGFADRYHECNPGIYLSADKAYFISFSIIILHTDVFNKNNKRKMQRSDYIKNSSCEGVSDDVLGCFYDNIAYTPFIHIDDEVDLKTISSKKVKRTAVLKGPMNDPARKAAKEPLDPYTLIFEGKLDALRPNIKDVMNFDDPYNYVGSTATLDTKNIYKSFSRYGVIQIVSSRSRPEAFMSEAAQENPLGTSVGIVEMPVTKVGILWRKDTKRKKARSPWQEWGAVLTRSGLSLFRNSSWAKTLMGQHDAHVKKGESGPVVFQPALPDFKQDHLIPMDGAVSLVDNTYKKHKHAFVMFTKVGEETFLADSEKDLNEWLGVLNYTAAFETLGVRSRGMVGGLYEGQRNRGIRRLNSTHSTKSIPTATGDVTIQSGKIDHKFAQQMMNARKELMQVRIGESEEKLAQAIKELEGRLRDARHLQILAPIQPKTREVVIHAAGRLSAKLKWARIEIWRMKCHRDILAQEFEDEKQGAVDKQGRIDRITEAAQPQVPQLSPHQSSRASRIGGLARLASKTSSITSGSKLPPPSPGSPSVRPGTKSSRDTEAGSEERFKTPPEMSRQPSPHDPPAQFQVPPISFSSPASDRRSSLASSPGRSLRLYPMEHRNSFSSSGGIGIVTSDDSSDDDLQYATPSPGEEPSTPELRVLDGPRPEPAADSEGEQSFVGLGNSPVSRKKQRRNLHRTLRESHGGSSHRRGHKGSNSASTIMSEDVSESEGLARRHGSFTVHGKKASVIQFGPDWHNATAEERLKTKKQLQDAAEAASADDKDGNSINSSGTGATVLCTTRDTHDYYFIAPHKSNHITNSPKQRHVSSATITPSSYHDSLQQQEQQNLHNHHHHPHHHLLSSDPDQKYPDMTAISKEKSPNSYTSSPDDHSTSHSLTPSNLAILDLKPVEDLGLKFSIAG